MHALEQGDARAQPALDIFKALYRVESEATKAGASPSERLRRRQEHSVALWERLSAECQTLSSVAQPKSPLGKAVTYFRRQEKYLRAFLDDGRLPISNAHVERQIRTVALFRKNSLFAGSVEAGQRHAMLLTMVLNCVLAGENPYEYLVWVIDQIAGDWPAARAAELLPRAYREARQAKQELDDQMAA